MQPTPTHDNRSAYELLAEAGTLLSSSLDYETTLAQVVRLCVPSLADWCAIDVLDDVGNVKRIAVHHPDPARVELALELERRYPPDPNAPTGVPNVLRTGATEWIREIPAELLRAGAKDAEHERLIMGLGLRSYIVVPIATRGRVLGALTLVHAESNRWYDEADVRLAQDLGRRAGQAVENALLYRDAEVVHSLGLKLAAELDREKLVEAIAEAATKLAGARFGVFFYDVLGDRGERFTLHKSAGAAPQDFAKAVASLSSARDVMCVSDVKQHPTLSSVPVTSFLSVPVVSRAGAVIGALFFGHEKAGAFNDRAVKAVTGVAAQAAIAMDNALLFQKAERLIQVLERSNAELDQFAYVTSHDLKAPLRGIGNLAQWIEEDVGPALGDKSKKHLDLMKGRIRRMEALIDGILDFSRAGRVKGSAEKIELDKLFADVVDLVAPKPPAAIRVAPKLPAVFCERVLLQQVLMNLVSNALKHAKRDDALVEISVEEDGAFIEIAIADNGPGIAPDFHERIWGIFQTLESRDKAENTGIGLAIVKKIVDARGGRAWVESAEGKGATFKVRWPKHTVAEKT